MLGKVNHHTNAAGKTAENRAVSDSAKFYAEDVSSQLNQDKEAWMAFASGKPMERYLGEIGANRSSLTPLKMIDHQFSRYQTNSSFRDLALYGMFVPYHHLSNNTTPTEGGSNRDNRPERVIVVRKCPSKMLVKSRVASLGGGEEEMPWWQRMEEDGMYRKRRPLRPEEDKIFDTLRENGLDPTIDVGFAYVVPYYPCTGVESWSSKEPPPEQVEHFAHYLKYIISCHSKAKCLVSFDGWTGRFLSTRCNYDQMQHISFAPEYGVPQLGLNLYPISAKYKLIKAYGLKLVNMPHPCMWEEGGKDPSLKLKYQAGVRAMQEGVLKSGQKSINPFSLMMSQTPLIPQTTISQEIDQGDINEEREEEEGEREEVDVDVECLLRRAGCTMDTDPFSIRPKLYSEEQWVVPDYLLKKTGGFDQMKCKCVRCGGNCGDKECIVCVCEHGHRTPMGECPHQECDVAKNCIRWCVTPYFRETETVLALYMKSVGDEERPLPFPSLLCLCVDKIRRLTSDPENYKLLRMVAEHVPDDVMRRFFSPCTLRESRESVEESIVSLIYEKCCNKYPH
jgi:hypothetical protein